MMADRLEVLQDPASQGTLSIHCLRLLLHSSRIKREVKVMMMLIMVMIRRVRERGERRKRGGGGGGG